MRSQGELKEVLERGWGEQNSISRCDVERRRGMTRPGLPGTLRWGGNDVLARLGTEWQPAQRRWGQGLEGWRSRVEKQEMETERDRSDTETQREDNMEDR